MKVGALAFRVREYVACPGSAEARKRGNQKSFELVIVGVGRAGSQFLASTSDCGLPSPMALDGIPKS
jgi:hypothetical protein